MAFTAQSTIGLAAALLVLSSLRLAAAPAPARSTAGVPISQTTMRDGTIRYAVWLKVGSRFVEALLDTGSTGLRVLPPVVPGDLTGLPTEADYANGVALKGLAITRRVEIGALAGNVPIEVVDHSACVATARACPVPRHGDTYLIGGDGASGHGYSAILGIGFTSRASDLPNPLEVLGAHQWIVALPPPDRPDATGRLVLDPEPVASARFKMAPIYKNGDFFGCLRATASEQVYCGAILLDSGGPAMMVTTQDVQTASVWAPGTAGLLRLPGDTTLPFKSGGLATSVVVQPTPRGTVDDGPFIMAGLYPYFFYDVLYDAAARKVGLAARETKPPVPAHMASADDMRPSPSGFAEPDGLPLDRVAPPRPRSGAARRRRHRASEP